MCSSDLEQASRTKMRFANNTQRFLGITTWQLQGTRAYLASLACALPLIFGFLLPTGILIHLIMREGYFSSERYLTWLTNTIGLAGITAITGVVIAIGLAYAARMTRGKWHTLVNRAVSMGYAVPGAVLAVGILVLLGQFEIGRAHV